MECAVVEVGVVVTMEGRLGVGRASPSGMINS